MVIFKNILVTVLLIGLTYFLIVHVEQGSPARIIFIFLTVCLIIFNSLMRTSLGYKNYFTSPFNIFTSNIRSENTYDVPKELMFKKVIEVINDSDFELAETDKDKFEILATTSMSFKSWGEILYIKFESKGSESIMKFCSSTFYQIFSWGKNQKNYDDLISEIESSFTV